MTEMYFQKYLLSFVLLNLFFLNTVIKNVYLKTIPIQRQLLFIYLFYLGIYAVFFHLLGFRHVSNQQCDDYTFTLTSKRLDFLKHQTPEDGQILYDSDCGYLRKAQNPEISKSLFHIKKVGFIPGVIL